MEEVLVLRDLTVKDVAGRALVGGVSLTLRRGRITALVGESGCGKSMTAAALMGLIDPPLSASCASLRVQGREMRGASEEEWRAVRGRTVALIPQDPRSALNPRMDVGDQLIEPSVVLDGEKTADAWTGAEKLLGGLGLSDPSGVMRGRPGRLSGGMAQRVMIAMALMRRPSVLLCDEPTTALDVVVACQILDILRQVRDDLGTACLFITHQLALCRKFADDVSVMRGGKILESGSASRVFRSPSHPYTAALLAAAPKVGQYRDGLLPVDAWARLSQETEAN